jgi:hypothetical protein
MVLVWKALVGTPLLAHNLAVDFIREGDTVKVEAFYPGNGAAAGGAHIRFTDSANRLIVEGTTGAEGAFTFTTAEQGPFAVEALHNGHRAETTVEAVDRGAAARHGEGPTGRRIESSRIRREPFPAPAVAAGLGVIFGLAGFLLAFFAWRRVRALAERIDAMEKDRNRAL